MHFRFFLQCGLAGLVFLTSGAAVASPVVLREVPQSIQGVTELPRPAQATPGTTLGGIKAVQAESARPSTETTIGAPAEYNTNGQTSVLSWAAPISVGKDKIQPWYHYFFPVDCTQQDCSNSSLLCWSRHGPSGATQRIRPHSTCQNN